MKKFPKSLPTFASTLEEPTSGFQGETPPITYDELVAIFGPPALKADSHKDTENPNISTMWLLKFSEGTKASIYDYRVTSLFSKELPMPSTFRRMQSKWHVGGDIVLYRRRHNPDAHALVVASIFLTWTKDRIIKAARDARETWVAPYFLSTAQVIAASRLAGKDYEQEFADLISYKGGYKC